MLLKMVLGKISQHSKSQRFKPINGVKRNQHYSRYEDIIMNIIGGVL